MSEQLIDLDALEQLAKAATPGPWHVWDGPDYVGGGRDLCIGAGDTWLANMDHRRCQNYPHHIGCHDDGCKLEGDADVCSVGDEVTAEQRATAELIAACHPQAVLAIIQRLRESERERDALALALRAAELFINPGESWATKADWNEARRLMTAALAAADARRG